jgi:hypothetical protein
MYIENVYYYFCEFKRAVECVIIEIIILIKNCWSLKCHQTRQVSAIHFCCNRTLPNHKLGTPTPQMGVREGVVDREWRVEGREEKERQDGSLVTR